MGPGAALERNEQEGREKVIGVDLVDLLRQLEGDGGSERTDQPIGLVVGASYARPPSSSANPAPAMLPVALSLAARTPPNSLSTAHSVWTAH